MASLDRRTFNRSLLAVPAAALAGASLGALAPAAASAAPADWDAQYVAGAGGQPLQHRTRSGADGKWTPSWNPVDGAHAFNVSCVGMYNGLNVVASNINEVPSHGIRAADGTWSDFTPIPSTSAPTGVPNIAATARANALHVFAATYGAANLYTTTRDKNGNWSPRWSAVKSFTGVTNVATTRVDSAIATAVTTDEDKLHLSFQASDGTWGGWGNVGNAAGSIGGFYNVALAGVGKQLHVFALSQTRGGIFHAIRRADGSWRQFRTLSVFGERRPSRFSAANVGGEIHVAIVEITASNNQVIRYSVRRTDGSWLSLGTISGSSSGFAGQPGAVAVGGTERVL